MQNFETDLFLITFLILQPLLNCILAFFFFQKLLKMQIFSATHETFKPKMSIRL